MMPRTQQKVIIRKSPHLDDQQDPEDCDAAVCCEEHVEAHVQTVIVEPGQQRVLTADDQTIEDTNVLEM